MVWAALVNVSQAAEAPPYSALLKQTLDQAPVLLEQSANVRAANANARQMRAWPNPTVDVLAENLGTPPSGGLSQRQDTYSVTQPLEIGGRRAARIEVGTRGVALAEAKSREIQVTYAARLAVAYATAEAMQRRVALAAEDEQRASEDLKVAKALVAAGKEANLRVAQAKASQAAAVAAGQAANADLAQALAQLSALAGAREPYTGVPKGMLERADGALPAVPSEAPAVATAAAERDALSAQVRSEQSQRWPTLGLTAGVRRYAWSRDRGLVVGLSASIPLFDQNRGAVTAAKERESAAEARLAAARLDAMAARNSAQAQVTAAEGALMAASEGEQAASDAYRLARIGYDAGKTSLMELLLVRKALHDARLTTVDARLSRIRALATLSAANGRIAFGD